MVQDDRFDGQNLKLNSQHSKYFQRLGRPFQASYSIFKFCLYMYHINWYVSASMATELSIRLHLNGAVILDNKKRGKSSLNPAIVYK